VSDAVDLLTAPVNLPRTDIRGGASLLYWSRVATLVMELLAAQRFVPDIHYAGDGLYRGFWRVVVSDAATSECLAALIASMPPVCRSVETQDESPQASTLVESFLWMAIDALVRRCLEGDELAHALHDPSTPTHSLQIQWLRSLVRGDSTLAATPDDGAAIHRAVRGWLAKLEPPPPERSCRTCFRLIPPGPESSSDEPESRSWQLTLFVQAVSDPALVVAAADLTAPRGEHPRILPRPFDNAREQLRADLALASRHFPPLAPCAEPSGPFDCNLSLSEAYTFLRDAAPILELEGFGVWTPKWWREDRRQLRMRLDIRPLSSDASVDASRMRLDALVAYDWRVALGDDDLSAEEITQLAAQKEPLVRLRGRWTEVQPSDLETALAFLERRGHGTTTVLEALRQCYVADELGTGLPIGDLRSHGWIDDLLNNRDMHEQVERLSPPAGFSGSLRPYQLKGLEWLHFLSRLGLGACLADDMGLGKTIQMIALWLHERQSGDPVGPTLLVVPMSLVGNWQREIERFASSLKVMIHHGVDRRTGQEFVDEVAKHDVVISTYALTHRDLAHLSAVQWHRIALDEAQNIKNPAAKQSAAVRSLQAIHRVALTGTPVENRLSELWSIIDFLNVGYLGSATDFRRRFAVPIERNHDADRAARLRHLIRPFVLRRLKSDPTIEVDLPAKMEMKVFCNLTREQAALYEAVVNDMLGQIDQSGGIQRRGLILAALVKLKQVCNHPALFLGDGSELHHRSGKCDRLTEMLEEVLAEGDRALIFTQYRQMGELLKKLMEDSFHREVIFLHGGTTRQQRDAMVERFQKAEDAPLFLLSLKAGGFGLNLTAANHVFHFDRWWNPAVEDQATDRAHRIGQTQRVQVHKFVCIGTLEERIDVLLEHKRNLADNIIGSGEEWLTELSTDGLRDLFALSREAVAED
jgi:SNF2 family DNA or RNA helicase